jgi:hypothetical protein
MTFEEASRRFNLPLKFLYRLREQRFITGPILTDADVKTVEIVSWVYWDPVALRARLSRISRARREDLIRTADLAKWESYVFNRYRNHIMNKSGGRLYVKQLADEIKRYYAIEKTYEVIRRIYRLRKKAHNELQRRTR